MGTSENQGIAAAAALFRSGLDMLDTAKAVAWFKDGGLDKSAPAATQAFLAKASSTFDPHIVPAPIVSSSLAPGAPRVR